MHDKLPPDSDPGDENRPKMSEDELILRKLLWMRHGCSGAALYGDDGEMQCHACMLDFVRAPATTLEWAFFEKNLRRLN